MKSVLFPLAMLVAFSMSACGPSYVRGSDDPEIDQYVMSTGLDKVDLEKLFKDNIDSLLDSNIVLRWQQTMKAGNDATVAIFPIQNETSEHLSSQLSALLSKFETELINSGMVTVVSHERQLQLIDELQIQESAAFDPDKSGQLGHQLGVQYFITGKIYDKAERNKDERRVQYFLFMQCIEVETGAIRWQNEAQLTKGLIN